MGNVYLAWKVTVFVLDFSDDPPIISARHAMAQPYSPTIMIVSSETKNVSSALEYSCILRRAFQIAMDMTRSPSFGVLNRV